MSPVTLAKAPFSHRSQSLSPVVSALLPMGQSTQEALPSNGCERPREHSEHSLLFVVLANLPGRQSRQKVFPESGWLFPTGHALQLSFAASS